MHLRAAAAQPLAKLRIQLRIDLRVVGAWRDAADDVEPVAVRSRAERSLVHEVRFLPQGHPEFRHIGVDGFAHEARSRHADDGGRGTVHHQRLPDDVWIAPEAPLPHAIAEYRNRRRARLVVRRGQAAAHGERHSEDAEVISGYQPAQQCKGRLRITLTMDQQRCLPRLECRHPLEALRMIAQRLVEVAGKQAPVAHQLGGHTAGALAPNLI